MSVGVIFGFVLGFAVWFLVRCVLTGFYTVQQNERAVVTSFGRAQRLNGQSTLDLPIAEHLGDEHKGRYDYPQSAIRQAGDNQVDIIKSRAEREASIEFAKAWAVRPKLVGNALREIGEDKEVIATLFELLETQEVIKGNAEVVLMPDADKPGLLASFEAGK